MSDRLELLGRYGRLYGELGFAIAFTRSTEGEDAKRCGAGWDKTRPLADGDYGAAYLAGRGERRNPALVLRPSRVIGLECDTPEGLAVIEALGLPETVTVRSSAPHRLHFWFRPWNRNAPEFVAFRFESAGITADRGRYLLVPPALHPSGTSYSFVRSPADVELAVMPEPIYAVLVRRAGSSRAELASSLRHDPQAMIVEGKRRETIFRYACSQRAYGVPEEAILEGAQALNLARCVPKLTVDQVAAQVRGALEYPEATALPARAPEPRGFVAAAAAPETWRAQSWAEFRDTSPGEIEFLVEGVWPSSSLGFIAARPKDGKTWLALAKAVSIASGRALFREYPIAGGARDVLYIALEGARAGLRARIGAIARGMGLDPAGDDLARLHVAYRPRPFNLADPELAALVIAEARRLDVAIVFVDVLRQATRGMKEASSEDFALVRDALEPLIAEGRSVALLHHFGKLTETQKERTPGERMAGSGAMEGALDVALYITRSEAGARRLRVEFEARDFATPEAIGVSITGTGTGEHGGFRYGDRAEFVLDPTAAEGRDLAAEAEEFLEAGKRWLTESELAGKELGIGANRDVVHAALVQSPERFVQITGELAKRAGRSSTAKPWGTVAMLAELEAADVVKVAPSAEQPEQPTLLEVHSPGAGAGCSPVGGEQPSNLLADTGEGGSAAEQPSLDSSVVECLVCDELFRAGEPGSEVVTCPGCVTARHEAAT